MLRACTRDFMYSTVCEMLQPECTLRTQEGCVEMEIRASCITYMSSLYTSFDPPKCLESAPITQLSDRLFCLDTVELSRVSVDYQQVLNSRGTACRRMHVVLSVALLRVNIALIMRTILSSICTQ
jgi:hypothetical protein